MIKFIVLGTLAVLVIAVAAVSLERPVIESVAVQHSAAARVSGELVEQRLERLEISLEQQQLLNRSLQDRVAKLEQELGSYPLPQQPIVQNSPVAADERGAMSSDDRETLARQRTLNALTEAGFDEFRAGHIVEEIERVRNQVLAQLDDGGRPDPDEVRLLVSRQLQLSLGEYDYEQYLDATGQSTRVSVREVDADSPAFAAGIQPGDEILRYAGERVFNSTELIAKTRDSVEGSSVLVELDRDGVRYSINVPAGSLGISIDRRR